MLVETVDHAVNLTNVYSMNKTAAWLWEAVCQEEHLTSETLVERLCEVYPVEYDRARHDVERQLAEWEQMGLLLLS